MGGNLGGLGGRSPPKKIEVGDGPCIRSPNILRSTVMGCKAEYEMTKKRCQGAIFLSEIEVFGQEKGVIYVIYQISDKIESEKGRQKFWAVKWIFSLKQVIRKFPSPKVGARSPPMG